MSASIPEIARSRPEDVFYRPADAGLSQLTFDSFGRAAGPTIGTMPRTHQPGRRGLLRGHCRLSHEVLIIPKVDSMNQIAWDI